MLSLNERDYNNPFLIINVYLFELPMFAWA